LKLIPCTFFSFFFSLALFVNAQESLDGIAAVIGDEIILKSEISAYSAMRLNSIGTYDKDSASLEKINKKFLEEMIDGKVLLAHAKKDTSILLTENEVEQALSGHINSLLRQNNLTMDALETELKRQQGITLSKFKSELRKAIKEQLLKQKVQQTYLFSLKINRKDVESFFNQYKDSLPQAGESVLLKKLSLVINPGDSIRQAAYEKILSIKQKLSNGEDFSELAKKYSESPEASEGGNLGFISKGSLSELAFEEKAFNLQPGQISEPFETRLGFHILNVIEKRDQKVNIRQIFLKVAPPEDKIKMVYDRLDSIRTHCKSSAEFSSIVSKISDDPISKNNKGLIGWISLLEMPANLRDAIDTLNAGMISKSIKEDNTVSIYFVEDRVEKRSLTIENDYALLSEKAKDIIAQKKLIDLVNKWKEDLFIDIRL
jgi:peptidyl-prolyl cis-trans isomerase SurA